MVLRRGGDGGGDGKGDDGGGGRGGGDGGLQGGGVGVKWVLWYCGGRVVLRR